jgi:catechol 2,3-dioxygenase-like lactoylglutathione lyase family enzyme
LQRVIKINIIALSVRDMARSVKFYRALGFQSNETAECPQVIFFNTTGTKFELYPIGGLAEDIGGENPPKIAEGFTGFTLTYNVKTEQEVRDTVELARKAGAVITKEPQSVFWGGYHAYFSDPDGYYWEVAYGADVWKFDEQDMLIL